MVLDDDLSSQTITSSCFTNRSNNWPDAPCACLETSMACVLGFVYSLGLLFPTDSTFYLGGFGVRISIPSSDHSSKSGRCVGS